jgi:hypothetical protein
MPNRPGPALRAGPGVEGLSADVRTPPETRHVRTGSKATAADDASASRSVKTERAGRAEISY